MLVSITNKCRMGCIHCMDDAKSDNNDFMDYDTFLRVIEFNFRYDKVIMLTGGEPTEHPQFWMFLSTIAQRMTKDNICIVTTNGMNMDNDDGILKDGLEKIIKSTEGEILFQVTSDSRYYPYQINKDNPIFKLKDVTIDTVHTISPVGRAVTNNLEYDKRHIAPKCFNIRSIIRSGYTFGNAINFLRSRGKMCCPQIAYDGSIKLGESTLCPAASHISKSENDIIKDINNFKCKQCKVLYDKLSPIHKYAIGEISLEELSNLKI